jgi:hypothetical protein
MYIYTTDDFNINTSVSELSLQPTTNHTTSTWADRDHSVSLNITNPAHMTLNVTNGGSATGGILGLNEGDETFLQINFANIVGDPILTDLPDSAANEMIAAAYGHLYDSSVTSYELLNQKYVVNEETLQNSVFGPIMTGLTNMYGTGTGVGWMSVTHVAHVGAECDILFDNGPDVPASPATTPLQKFVDNVIRSIFHASAEPGSTIGRVATAEGGNVLTIKNKINISDGDGNTYEGYQLESNMKISYVPFLPTA